MLYGSFGLSLRLWLVIWVEFEVIDMFGYYFAITGCYICVFRVRLTLGFGWNVYLVFKWVDRWVLCRELIVFS